MEQSRTQFGNARSCQIDSARVRFGGKSGRKGNSESPFSEASPSPQVRQVAQWESCHLEDWSPRMVIPFWNNSIWTREESRRWREITDERSIVLLRITVKWNDQIRSFAVSHFSRVLHWFRWHLTSPSVFLKHLDPFHKTTSVQQSIIVIPTGYNSVLIPEISLTTSVVDGVTILTWDA